MQRKVFHMTSHSFALVNLKPLLKGHVLVCPQRVTPRVSDLSEVELTDLFLTVQRVGNMIQRKYGATSLNIAIQDGLDAGQSVPHVHTHIIPRKRSDLDNRGGSDAIYAMLDGDEGNVGKHQWLESKERPQFPGLDNESRKPRGADEMAEEARALAAEMQMQTC